MCCVNAELWTHMKAVSKEDDVLYVPRFQPRSLLLDYQMQLRVSGPTTVIVAA